jgi:hypothetical protein
MSRRSRAAKPVDEPFCNPIIWLAAGVLLTLVLVGGWFINRSLAENGPGTLGPRLAVNQERLDVGTQPFNKIVRAEFTLTNAGDRTLQLDASSPVRVLEGC